MAGRAVAKIEDGFLLGAWYYIEHNLHKGGCTGGQDIFSKTGNSLTLTKHCTGSDGKPRVSALSVRRTVPTSINGDFTVISERGGILGTELRSKYIVYAVGGDKGTSPDTDGRYMVIGNGGSSGAPGGSLYFAILYRKPSMEVCKLATIEGALAQIGLNTSDVIRESGALIPCDGKK